MSGLCDTCYLKPRCISPCIGMANCSLYEPKDKSRWHELFGTPERAARSMASGFSTPDGIYGDYDALLEWLRGDAE